MWPRFCKWKTAIWSLELVINKIKQNYLNLHDLSPLSSHPERDKYEIERNGYEITEWDILLWTISHRNTVLYTVKEYRTIYCTVPLHYGAFIISLSYKLAGTEPCLKYPWLERLLIVLLLSRMKFFFEWYPIKIDIRPRPVSRFSDPVLSGRLY